MDRVEMGDGQSREEGQMREALRQAETALDRALDVVASLRTIIGRLQDGLGVG